MKIPEREVERWSIQPRRFEIRLKCGHWVSYPSDEPQPPHKVACFQCAAKQADVERDGDPF